MDGMNLVWAVAGFVAGGVAVAALFETRLRARPDTGASKLTTGWRLTELHEPWIVARDVPAVDVPPGSRVLASGLVDPTVMAKADVRTVPPVRAEFALDLRNRRAFLFLGGVAPGSLALLTVDPDTVTRLEQEARGLWDRATAYVERLPVAQLVGKHGITVETEGRVQAVLPYQGRFMLRLEDGGAMMGVLVDKEPSELADERIVVRGRLERDRGGYTVLSAEDVRRIR